MESKRHRLWSRTSGGDSTPRANRWRPITGTVLEFLTDRGSPPRRRSIAFLCVALVTANAVGCRLVGRGGTAGTPSSPSQGASIPLPEGPFDGFLEIEGGRINGVLTVTPAEGNQIEGFFESSPDLVAMGRGRIRGEELWMELSYEGACPGRMEMVGKWEPASREISGSVRASDCTGVAQGTFLFRRY